MRRLSKSKLIAHMQCPKRLWLQAYQPDLAEPGEHSLARLTAGTRLGEIARELYPGGRLINPPTLSEALEQTENALAKRIPIYEATFAAQNVLIKADVLWPDGDGYRLFEVKSSSRVKDHHLPDAAIQAWVAQAADVPLTRTAVGHIDTGFTYNGDGDYRGLLQETDVTEEVAALGDTISTWVREAETTLDGPEPAIAVGDHCSTPFECPFQHYCSPPDPDARERFPPTILPYGGATVRALEEAGYEDLRDVPADLLTNPKHFRVWRATCRGEAELLPGAAEQLHAIGYPRYYLDFETIAPPIPVWRGTHPYEQVPFQWSCHIEFGDGRLEHRVFLADGSGDPRRPFSETLAAVLEPAGPILVYHASFERARMRDMAALFPDLAPALNAAIERIVDLLPIARDNYYHPTMRGSWSIKAVLPTIAPELAYDDLEVGDGGMAQEAFAEILDTATTEARRQALRDALLKYCERDTLAMVRIAHFFEGRSDAS